MHVAMLVFNQPFKGTYWRAYYIGRELCRRGHTVTLLATAPHERWRFRVTYEEQNRLAIVEAPDVLNGSMRSGWDAWASMARAAWLQLARFDLIHAFECRPSVILPALAARARSDMPLVIDWCDWFGRGGSVEERHSSVQKALLRPAETFFEEHFRTYADATTVINSVLAQKAIALGVDPASITLLPNGSDTAGWLLEDRHAARAALGLPADAPLIGYVGAIFERDARLMAQAFDRVVACMPTARLLVLGYCNVAIEQLVARPENVIRTGPLDTATLRRYLHACTIGWVPLCDTGANRGRWPLKLNTYMEAGLPFVTTRVGDLGAFVEQCHAGTAAAPTPDDVAAHALRLLRDPARAAALGREGRRLSENELSWARVADVAEGVYRQLLG
ncbi:MAG TPA: glycosyltransferase family 4 protein [Roseiflexaceae bacterium]|jgi:glycosyltransferase involved in cell wall biosynthesis|nr:glycosyltransferase family 4 protein [Roseiflexaceae bacterium]